MAKTENKLDLLLDKYADLATDLADGATQINFHNFHGEDMRKTVFVNIRKAMAQLLAAYSEAM